MSEENATENVTLRLGELSFELRDGVSVGKLEEEIVKAARKGADVVTVPLRGEGEVDALVTAAVPVALERHAAPGTPAEGDGREPAVEWGGIDLAC
ncbi:hypothetical protein [Gryllotalpicola kribbensis]|jgi:hypothetical protein|uniref:hypothetical protein n=1 Tax=Gryllotalpicola kribbensis TaxID=993084 RepID=UPI0031E19D20